MDQEKEDEEQETINTIAEYFKSEYRDYLNTSDIRRNPITGAGFETEENHRSRRHYTKGPTHIDEKESKIKDPELFKSEYRDYLNTSDMKRNPATGVGFEAGETHSSRRHYAQRTPEFDQKEENNSDLGRYPSTGLGFEDTEKRRHFRTSRRHYVQVTTGMDEQEAKNKAAELFKSEYRDYLNTSAIRRNPVTGVGFDAEEKHYSRRHYAKTTDTDEKESEYGDYSKISGMERWPATDLNFENKRKHGSRRHYAEVTRDLDEKGAELFKSEYRDYFNTSNIQRNPATGVGFESEKQSSRRHYNAEVTKDLDEKDVELFKSEYRNYYLNASAMKRNPVTGEGFEGEEKYFSRRHCVRMDENQAKNRDAEWFKFEYEDYSNVKSKPATGVEDEACNDCSDPATNGAVADEV